MSPDMIPSAIFVAAGGALKIRGRAGLAFERDAFSEVKVDLDANDEQIKTRQAAGEKCVNERGYAAITNDPALDVRTEKPVAPPPRVAPRCRTTRTPDVWLELAKQRGVRIAVVDRERARPVVEAILAVVPAGFADPPLAQISRRYTQLVMSGVPCDELARLHRVVSGCTDVPASFGTLDKIPAVQRARYATNEGLAPWQQTVAGMIDLDEALPGPFPQATLAAEAQAIDVEEVSRLRNGARWEGGRFESGAAAPRIQSDMSAREIEEYKAEVQARRDELHARGARMVAERSEAIDRVRRGVLASIDNARATATDPVTTFALELLALEGRGMAFSLCLTVEDALRIALRTVSFVAVDVPELTDERVTGYVATRDGLQVRSRAGLVFSPVPTHVDLDQEQARAIRADPALIFVESRAEADRIETLKHATDAALDDEIAKRKAAALARRSSLRSDDVRNSGRPQRTTSRRKADEPEPVEQTEPTDGGAS